MGVTIRAVALCDIPRHRIKAGDRLPVLRWYEHVRWAMVRTPLGGLALLLKDEIAVEGERDAREAK